MSRSNRKRNLERGPGKPVRIACRFCGHYLLSFLDTINPEEGDAEALVQVKCCKCKKTDERVLIIQSEDKK
jgi:hypothetical protein